MAAKLTEDWHKSIAAIRAVMASKLYHWSELPYTLCALGPMDAAVDTRTHSDLPAGCQTPTVTHAP